MDILERARRYVARLEPAVSGAGGHDRTFHTACVLVQGFALGEAEAMDVLREYNARCAPPWSEKELLHKIRQADTATGRKQRGWLRGADQWRPNESWRTDKPGALPAEVTEERKPEYLPEALEKVAGDLKGKIDLVWLANRSWTDPATVTRGEFLHQLYDRATERVVVFTTQHSQGQALWPLEPLPRAGPDGVWFLAAPVDGKWRETQELDAKGQRKRTRRSGSCVTSWRWAVLESDEAPAASWLAALARLPLAIAALYTSGGRSVHALVKTRARTKEEWDQWKQELRPALVTLGADPGALSAVRLTRLPGTMRERTGKPQKLLFLNPRADGRPLIELPVLRDVEEWWGKLLAEGPADADESGGDWIVKGAEFYASRSPRLRECLERWDEVRR